MLSRIKKRTIRYNHRIERLKGRSLKELNLELTKAKERASILKGLVYTYVISIFLLMWKFNTYNAYTLSVNQRQLVFLNNLWVIALGDIGLFFFIIFFILFSQFNSLNIVLLEKVIKEKMENLD